MVALARQWLWFPLLTLMAVVGGAGQAQTPDVSEMGMVQGNPRVQVLDGRISSRGLQFYRIPGLTRGAVICVRAEVTAGHLDPLVALLKPDASQEALSRESLEEQIKVLSRDHDPLEVARQIMDRYALAWNDDYQGHYHAALKMEVPADGDYWLAVGSSLVRSTAGGYRLIVANFTATDERARLQYRLPWRAERYRLRISSQGPAGKATAGGFRLLVGLNTPEVLQGKGEPTGREILQEPIPVSIGVKMQQLTSVNQKTENFGVVATVLMHWQDPRLAYDPEQVQDRFKVFLGDAFAAEMNRLGQTWPQYTVVNQQDRQWVQNRVVVIRPDGEAVYFERVSLTLQAPDFDFRNFPFDRQRFFIRFDLLAPEWKYQLREIEGYSEIGKQLGEEEWVITAFDTSISRGQILQRPVSRFNFEFSAKRHVEY